MRDDRCAVFAVVAGVAIADDAKPPPRPVQVTAAWVRATRHGAPVAGGATVGNNQSVYEGLIGARLAMAPEGEIHEGRGIGTPRKIVSLAPHYSGTLRPSDSCFLVFYGLTRDLIEGERVDGSIVFANAVTFVVAGAQAMVAPGCETPCK